jgi:hypothetical protein
MAQPAGGLSDAERSRILDQNLVALASQGGRISTRTDTQAVVVTGKPVNHLLHVVLSLFCCGWWVPIWLLLTAIGGEKRKTITVDWNGHVEEQKAPLERYRFVLLAIAGLWLLVWIPLFGSFVSAFGGD